MSLKDACDRFNEVCDAIEIALGNDLSLPREQRKMKSVRVSEPTRLLPSTYGKAHRLSFVVFIRGANHGMRIELYGDREFVLEGWCHSQERNIMGAQLRLRGHITKEQIEMVATMVGLPLNEETPA